MRLEHVQSLFGAYLRMIKILEHDGCIIHKNTPVLPCSLEHVLHFTHLGFDLMDQTISNISLFSKKTFLTTEWQI